MDYGKVIGDAWQISKRWKILWVLGLLSVLSLVFASNIGPSWIMDDNFQGALARAILPPGIVAIAATFSCVAVLLAIALWVVSVIARGGLIAGVKQIVETGGTDFGSAWGEGASRFWSLFGIGVLMLIAVFVMTLVIGLFISLVGLVLEGLFQTTMDVWTIFALSGLLVAIGGAILGVVRIYAEQAAVQEKLNWTASFGRGWQVLKENLGTTVVFLFFFLGVGVIIWVVVMLISVMLGIGVGATFWSALTYGSGGVMGLSLCCLGLFGIVIALLLEGFLQTFTMSTWTLAYREMAGLDAEPVEAAAVEEADEPVAEGEPTEA